MKIGFDPRVPGQAVDASTMLSLVTEGERMGYDYVTFSDHLLAPKNIEASYPYKADGKWLPIAADARHDLLTTIAYFAAKTTTLRFVTSVMVVPYRLPLLTAKILTTIDVLSDGRLTVGVGTGWMKEEFEALNSPDFRLRGKVTDEYLEVMTTLWTDSEPSFEGEYARFGDISFEPKPTQKPYPPLWVGGLSQPALRRTARFGDAWYPVPTDQKHPMDSLPRLKAGIARMRSTVAAEGRDPDEITVAMRIHEFGESLPDKASDGARRLFSGRPEDVAEDLAAIEAFGVTSADFRFGAETLELALEGMMQFQSDVVETSRSATR